MAGELEMVVRDVYSRSDARDFEAALRSVATDVQAVDEISRTWMRRHGDLRAYFDRVAEAVGDIRTVIRDVHEAILGDTGLVTCWIDQDYTLEGEPVHVSAPTSLVFRRQDGEWRISLFHSIPLPNEA